jgi:acetone carboxylase gamma subunit
MSLSRDDLAALIDGKLPWPQVRQVVSAPKDDDRFQRLLEILQARVPWPEKILLPLSAHLYIVERGSERIVKCDCGHEFGDWRRNWKLSALILARDTPESLEEIYPGHSAPGAELGEVREYICPTCATLLKVETVPLGYPVIFDALPDLDGFYREWLKAPLPVTMECVDKSDEPIRAWARETEPSQAPPSARPSGPSTLETKSPTT